MGKQTPDVATTRCGVIVRVQIHAACVCRTRLIHVAVASQSAAVIVRVNIQVAHVCLVPDAVVVVRRVVCMKKTSAVARKDGHTLVSRSVDNVQAYGHGHTRYDAQSRIRSGT